MDPGSPWVPKVRRQVRHLPFLYFISTALDSRPGARGALLLRTAPLGRFTVPRPDLRRLREFRPRVGALTLNVCTNEKHSGNKAPEFQEGSPNLVPGTAPVKPLFRNPVFFLGFILALGWFYFGFILAPFWLHFGTRGPGDPGGPRVHLGPWRRSSFLSRFLIDFGSHVGSI